MPPIPRPGPLSSRLRPGMDSLRQNKVNSLLQQELGTILQQEGGRLLPGAMIAVTGVRVSPDLGMARVYVKLLPREGQAGRARCTCATTPVTCGAAGQGRGQAAPRGARTHFHLDDSLDRAEEIDRLLKG